jgi:hydrogenase maturation factor
VVVQVGPAPLEGAAVLAAEAPDSLGSVEPGLLTRARTAAETPGFSVVEPALVAARWGASALHDPTEGGLASGLYELAEASGLALELDTSQVSWFEPGLAVCRAVGADPWGTLASGALLAAFPPEKLREALVALEKHGSPGREIARGKAGHGVHDTQGRPLPRFEQDEVARVLSQL